MNTKQPLLSTSVPGKYLYLGLHEKEGTYMFLSCTPNTTLIMADLTLEEAKERYLKAVKVEVGKI